MTVSHTEPVTVAAEQGARSGSLVYLALIVGRARGLLAACGVAPAWARRETRCQAPPAGAADRRGRAAVLAAFVALLVHTLAYAGFFEDPITWVLLAVGASLSRGGPGPRPA